MAKALDEWLGQIEAIHPVGWDLGLDRVGHVGELMDLLHPARQVVLVAGTNGKGSCCEYLARMAMSAGLKTGKSTSPHLFRFNERIVIDGKEVDDEEIVAAFRQIDEARAETTLTYFEFAALASLLIFKQRGVDIAILEIGLGGRLDAMNIVDPDLCVITSISVDHESWLGSTREAIAREKAGIMRPGVRCIVSDRNPPATLIEEAASHDAALDLIGQAFDISPQLTTRLPRDSFAAASHAAFCLDLAVDAADMDEIAATATLPGRRTWRYRTCPILLDVAHNPAAALDFSRYVASLEVKGRVHALLGIYGDKDIQGVLGPIRPLVKTWHLTDLDDPRASSAADLADHLAEDRAVPVATYDKINLALDALEGIVSEDDLILVLGSFPVVAGALNYLDEQTLD